MASKEAREQYIPTIGIECHVQLKTKTKLFSAVSNDARAAAPNTLISHIDVGMPGALPVLNEKAVEYAVRMAYAFHTEPQSYSYFERKHYFYPDLPKGYQITQLSHPIILGGYVEVEVGGEKKKIRLHRVQIEEDAGKSTHPAGKDYSLVDLNRAGTPLLEIVSEPDIHTPEEAKAYAEALYMLVKFADVSDADMYHGNMRFDVNVSVSKDPKQLGKRTETKNLNSFKSVEKAVAYEIDRQIELLEKGQEIAQETRGWDDAKQKTFSQRSKEEAHDYRYFPDPDLPPLELDDAFTEKIKQSMPVMPDEWRQRLSKLDLSSSHIDTLLLAEATDETTPYLEVLERLMGQSDVAKMVANWMVNIEIPFRRDEAVESVMPAEEREKMYREVAELTRANKVSSTNAKALLTQLVREGKVPASIEQYAESKGLIQVSDTGEIEKFVDEVIAENPKAAEDIKNGELKAIGFLVGQVMKKSQGKANPGLAQQLIKQKLGG